MSVRPLGVVVSIVALAVPFIWLPGIAHGRDVIALFSQYLGIAALIAMALLQLIESNATPEIIRQSAAVHFKNIVKKAWDEANEVRLEVDVKLKLSIARVNHLLFS